MFNKNTKISLSFFTVVILLFSSILMIQNAIATGADRLIPKSSESQYRNNTK